MFSVRLGHRRAVAVLAATATMLSLGALAGAGTAAATAAPASQTYETVYYKTLYGFPSFSQCATEGEYGKRVKWWFTYECTRSHTGNDLDTDLWVAWTGSADQ
ncbi:hypothetical protein [Nonomuraea glycinis]|uniref:hypothetical protein n=1 Tax=Nonomuraea glycinis TaxID=2047744 RepID=UPI0033A9269A